jgi:hypothetical protein
MKLEAKVPTHARKRCPEDLSKKPTTLGDQAIRSSKYLESAGTSNPTPPRSFRRGGEPSFKD